MSDVYHKFIIEQFPEEGLVMILAKCTFHRQLAHVKNNVKSGGWWYLEDNNTFVLYGDSNDFGRPKIEDLARCVQDKKVFSSYVMCRNFTDKFSFMYKNEVGEFIDLNTYPL